MGTSWGECCCCTARSELTNAAWGPLTGQEDALLPDHSVEALWEASDELSSVGHLCGPLHLLGCDRGEVVSSIGNVLSDRAGEQDWLLKTEWSTSVRGFRRLPRARLSQEWRTLLKLSGGLVPLDFTQLTLKVPVKGPANVSGGKGACCEV